MRAVDRRFVLCTLIVLSLLFSTFSTVEVVKGAVVWSDDFNDGDYVGWNIVYGFWLNPLKVYHFKVRMG